MPRRMRHSLIVLLLLVAAVVTAFLLQSGATPARAEPVASQEVFTADPITTAEAPIAVIDAAPSAADEHDPHQPLIAPEPAAKPGETAVIADDGPGDAAAADEAADDPTAPLPAGIPTEVGGRPVAMETIEERDPRSGRMLRQQRAIVADRVLVRLRPEAAEAELTTLNQRFGARTLRRLRLPGAAVYEVQLRGRGVAAVRAAIDAYQDAAQVVSRAEADPVFTIAADPPLPDDEHFDNLWGLHNTGQSGGVDDADIDAPEAWQQTTGDDAIRVAVIDTGIDYTHPDLAPNIWTNPGEIADNGIDDDGNGYVDDVHGYDFYNDDGDPMDDHLHGTHCAGTIGALGNDGTGVAGVAWDVGLVAVKGLGGNGSSTGSILAECLAYANAIGVDITSNSWGGSYSELIYEQVVAAADHGIITVVAAGNAATDLNRNPTTYPACIELPHVVTVAATDREDAIADFSNWGNRYVDIGAPGVGIVSCMPMSETEAMKAHDLPTGYAGLNGTSMATPHVAGACVLAKASDPTTTPELVRLLLAHTADPTAAMATTTSSGGRLNVAELVRRAGDAFLIVRQHRFDDDASGGSAGNADGMWEAGEIVGLQVDLQNIGGQDITAARLRLTCDDPTIDILDPELDIGAVAAHANIASGEIRLAIANDVEPPTTVDLQLTISGDGTTHVDQTLTMRIVRPETIRGRVIDGATGNGLAGVRIRAYSDTLRDTWTDTDGRYELRVPAGTMPVLATRRSWSPDSSTVTTPAEGVDFVLDEWELRSMRLDEASHMTYPYPMDMNAYGHVLAEGFTGLPHPHGWVFEADGHRRVACSLIHGYYPGAINDFGDVASRTFAGNYNALFDRHGVVTDISHDLPRMTTVIKGVDNEGRVICSHSGIDGNDDERAWLIDPLHGTATMLVDALATPTDISDTGMVVGYAVHRGRKDSGFHYDIESGTVEWLDPPIGDHLHPLGCSADGTRGTGVLIWDDGTLRGYVSDGTTVTPLADPWQIQALDRWYVEPRDVDDAGRCVGIFFHERYRADTRVAMLHLGDIPIDLNEVAPTDAELILQEAHFINEAGDICGLGVNQFGIGEIRNEITWVLSRKDRIDLPPVARIDTVGRTRPGSDLPLSGVANDEQGDTRLSRRWSKLSGPGTAIFADDEAWQTTVRFDQAGTYQLQLRVADASHQVEATCTVVVDDAPNDAPSVELAYEATSDFNIHTSWSGAGAKLTASPSDPDGSVVEVAFYEVSSEPVLVGRRRHAPWQTQWQTDQAGSFRLQAQVTDDRGATAWSNIIELTTTRDQEPVITMETPVHGQAFGQFESVTARAICNHPKDDLTRIYLYLDGDRYHGWTSRSGWPGTYEFTFDKLEPGRHIIHFQVIDLYDARPTRQGYHVMSEVAEIIVGGQPGIAAPVELTPAMRGRFYGAEFTPSGSGPYSWSLTDGALPDGIQLLPDDGVLVGTPTVSGSFPFTLQVDNPFGFGNRAYVLDVLDDTGRTLRIRADNGPWNWLIQPADGPDPVIDGADTRFERRSRFQDYQLQVDDEEPTGEG